MPSSTKRTRQRRGSFGGRLGVAPRNVLHLASCPRGVTSLSRRIGDGVCEINSSHVDVKASNLHGPSRRKTRDNDVQEFAAWGAMIEKLQDAQ